jgi:hypothetical protein
MDAPHTVCKMGYESGDWLDGGLPGCAVAPYPLCPGRVGGAGAFYYFFLAD